MSTNKTRLLVSEWTGSKGPYNATTEFDIYQEAYDYAFNCVSSVGAFIGSGATTELVIWLFSYDNTSYRFQYSDGEVLQTEVSFP